MSYETSITAFAERELSMLKKTGNYDKVDEGLEETYDAYEQKIIDSVKELIEVFSKQSHSGMSASIVIDLFDRLANWKPLSDLTGADSEWGEAYSMCGGVTQQNTRYSAVFRKNFDNSTAYNVEGKVFSRDGGKSWFTNSDSAIPIEFPYYVPNFKEHVYLDTEEGEE